MNRKEELERLYRRGQDANGLGKPARALREGVPPLRRRASSTWTWVSIAVLLLAAGGTGVVACKLAKDGMGQHEASTMLVENKPSADGKLAKEDTAKVSPDQIKAYLTPSEAEVLQLYRYVVTAPFVAENIQYKERLKDIPFVYLATNDIVNAAAGRQITEKDGKKGLAFHTVFCGGAARYARLVGLAAALQDAGHKDMLKKFVVAMPRRFCVRCAEADCVAFIAENGLAPALTDEKIRQKALSYSSGTIVSVLAHECGHHAFGHLLSFSEKANMEISRNQEREADSFASSVMSACPFGEYIFAGTLFWHYAMAMQGDGDSDAASSHPLSKERFENFVRANAEKAATMGITLTLASSVRKLDNVAFSKEMEAMQRTVNQEVRAVENVSDVACLVHPCPAPVVDMPPPRIGPVPLCSPEPTHEAASVPRHTIKASFRERQGAVAMRLYDVTEWLGSHVIRPMSEWFGSLDQNQRILFWVLLGGIVLIPVVTVGILTRREARASAVNQGVTGCAALAGAVFTIWGGFEIGGPAGEWLAGTVMALMGLAALLAVIGGIWSGKNVTFKIVLPFMFLMMVLLEFVIAVVATIVFIVIIMVMIALWLAWVASDCNTVYECPRCGRLFHGKPSSCSCGAQFC